MREKTPKKYAVAERAISKPSIFGYSRYPVLIQKNATFVTAYPEGLGLPGVLCVGFCCLKVKDETPADSGHWGCLILCVIISYFSSERSS